MTCVFSPRLYVFTSRASLLLRSIRVRTLLHQMRWMRNKCNLLQLAKLEPEQSIDYVYRRSAYILLFNFNNSAFSDKKMKLTAALSLSVSVLILTPSWTSSFSTNGIMKASLLSIQKRILSNNIKTSISIKSSTDGILDTLTYNSNERDFELLSLPARVGRPLQIAIAGGGVGGLTAALCMLKKGFDVTVYEKTASFARFGGPIQFASNALSVLKEIDEQLFQRIMDKFTFTGTRTCGIKDGLRAKDFQMTQDSIDYLWNPDAPADWFVKFPLQQCADVFGLPYTGVIDRPDLQDILIDECRKLKSDFIRNGNPVVSYETHGKGKGVTVNLSDGTSTKADVLVGADGIWSAVRAQMFKEEMRKSSKDMWRRQGCTYSGYTVFAGETIYKSADYYDTGYKVYIGPQRYFVTSDVGDGRIQWYAFFAFPPGTKRAPSGWGGSERKDQADQEENLVQYIKSLHSGWSDEVMQILDATSPDSVEQRDLYDRAPEVFRGWVDGNVVLMGDSVHPMMPNLGQGGCQAIEDAFVLSESLAAIKTTKKIETALKSYFQQRIFRVSIIQGLSRLASDLIVNAFDTPWSPHDIKGTSWKSYLTFLWKPILQYAIFPAQFAYLYSYHPTGSMNDLPRDLAAKWKANHNLKSEEAFSRVALEGQKKSSAPSFFKVANMAVSGARE